MTTQHQFHDHRRAGVAFSRQELRVIMDVYSRRVVTGEWRDYAIDMDRDRAAFSVFRHSLENPLYVIEKFARNDGFRLSSRGRKLLHGGSISEILAVLDGRPRLVATAD